MNNDNLSDNQNLIYDNVGEQYVVSQGKSDSSSYPGRDPRLAPRPEIRQEIKKQNIFSKIFQNSQSFFKKPSSSRPPFGFPNRPPNNPSHPPYKPNYAVKLSREIYNDFDVLIKAYKDLLKISNEDELKINNLENQMLILKATMGNIYRTLSGNTLPPLSGQKIDLKDNYCASLYIIAEYLEFTNEKVIKLMQAVSIQSIDRQLFIINATLNTQEKTVRNLYNECRLRRD